MRYESKLFEYFDNLFRQVRIQPVFFGGVAGPSGGTPGGPGIVGYIPQTYIAYDTTEDETLYTPTSGASLLDNLNHIRYRIGQLETSASGFLVVKENGVVVSSGVTVLDFDNTFNVVETSSGIVEISIAAPDNVMVLSGIHGEDLSSQIGSSQTHFSTENEFSPGSLRVYYNGIRQANSYIEEDVDNNGFTTSFTVLAGDSIVVDYDTFISGYSSTFLNNYVTKYELYTNYYDSSDVDALLAGYSQTNHTHLESDIIDIVHNADYIMNIPIASGVPASGDALIYNSSTNSWESRSSYSFEQQILFTIEGQNLGSSNVGIKPLKVYINDVGSNCTISEVFCSLGASPLTYPLRINVLKNGVSIFNINKYIEIPVGSNTATKDYDFLSNSLTKGDYLQIEIVQGDDNASDLVTHIRFIRRF